MPNQHDNSWFSERTKNIIVTVTMSILIGGMAWGYYAAYQWKAERTKQDEQRIEKSDAGTE